MKFLYDHLNSTEDVTKAKSIGAQQLIANMSSYLMQCAVMTRDLFEVGDESEKAEARLSKEVTKQKSDLKDQTRKAKNEAKKLA